MQRQNAKSEFEADLAKLQANATFGKTMESMRKRVNIRLIADSAKLLKAVSKPSYREAQIVNPDLVMVRAARQKNLIKQTDCRRILRAGTFEICNVQVLLRLSKALVSRSM